MGFSVFKQPEAIFEAMKAIKYLRWSVDGKADEPPTSKTKELRREAISFNAGFE